MKFSSMIVATTAACAVAAPVANSPQSLGQQNSGDQTAGADLGEVVNGLSKREPGALLGDVQGLVSSLGQEVHDVVKGIVQKADVNDAVSIDQVRSLVDKIGQTVAQVVTKVSKDATKTTGSEDVHNVSKLVAQVGNDASSALDKVLADIDSTLKSAKA